MNQEELKALEELEIDESELELILKQQNCKYDFPVVCISTTNAFFNGYAKDIVPPYIHWFTTSEYVVGLPAKTNEKNAYKTRKVWNEIVAHLPQNLRNHKKLANGHYKVYKYKDGFAFKRYEQIEKPV